MSRTTVRACDRCGHYSTVGNPVAGYRWMILPGYVNYKGLNLVKVDLCKACNNAIVAMLNINIAKKEVTNANQEEATHA